LERLNKHVDWMARLAVIAEKRRAKTLAAVASNGH
jgi:hypothetical protein